MVCQSKAKTVTLLIPVAVVPDVVKVEQQEQEKKKLGSNWREHGLLFTGRKRTVIPKKSSEGVSFKASK